MNLHEYQAKQLMPQFSVSVPQHGIATNTEEAIVVVDKLGGQHWVVKAQVHAGARGKAGGVLLVHSKEELFQAIKQLIGTYLVTAQTDNKGQPVHQVLIEEPSSIQSELYLSAVIDRALQRIVFVASRQGGMDIEEVAQKHPESLFKVIIDPIVGMQPYQCRELFFGLALDRGLLRQFTQIVMGLYQMFIACDLSLLEINPLAITQQGQLVCLDAKINIDDNALYRQPKLRALRDPSQEDEREHRARQWELSYIALEGEIGCMVNGAGLAMATMDMIKLKGGQPANFLDVGGGTTKERVAEAFKIILDDHHVKGILINIFGGIVRCDLIAQGIVDAVCEVGVNIPIVVRLKGNNADLGSQILAQSSLNIIPVEDLSNAAQMIVQAVKNHKESV